MEASDPRLIGLLIENEGLRLTPYRCPAGHWTWGVGRNLEARPLDLEEQLYLLTHGPTEKTARWLLERDLERAACDLDLGVPGWRRLPDARQAVVWDLGYNLGGPRLRRFTRFLAAVARGEWLEAGRELERSEWWHQVGRRGPRLRRMMETGRWPEELEEREVRR